MWLILAITAYGADQSLLHIGNSYTDRNDLPDIVGALLEEAAPTWNEVERRKLTGGGWTLAQHAAELSTGPNNHTESLVDAASVYDFVILQEQSQTAGFDPSAGTWQASLAAAVDLNAAIRDHGAETLFFLTWGRRDGDNQNPDRYPDFITMQGHLTDGYLAYGDELSTRKRPVFMAPAGPAFQTLWEDTSDPSDPNSLFYRLYAGDGSHPSYIGSMLVARVFYASITGRSPVGLAFNPDAIESSDLEILSVAAHDVVLSDPFGPMRFPFALTWEEFAGDETTVVIGGGGIRYQIRVEEDAGPVAVTLTEGLLWIQETLQVSEFVGDADLAEVALDGGRWVVTSESPVHIELYSFTGLGGTLEFTGLESWLEADFPAIVLTAATLDIALDITVPAGFEVVVDDTSVTLTSDGTATADGSDRKCGCEQSPGAIGWMWLIGLVAIRARASR
jgi:hypothetical protein